MPNINKIRLSGTTYTVQDENACKVVELTQAQYDELPTTAKTSNSLFVITDATAGDLSNYYTKTETDNAITAATSTKQDTLVSGTNIKTINGETLLGEGNITIQGGSGGGKAVSAGTNISITTGETADTINCTLPITADTNTNAPKIKIDSNYSLLTSGSSVSQSNTNTAYSNILFGKDNTISNSDGFGGQLSYNFFLGEQNSAENNIIYKPTSAYNILCGIRNTTQNSHGFALGRFNTFSKNYQFAVGFYHKPKNEYEASFGRYSISVSASGAFGDGGNTLFSLGNGSSDNAIHNAFEIRQNGDIYIADTNDTSTTNYYEKPMIKLQDALGGGGGGGTSYTAGDGIDITNDVISVTGKVDTSTYNTYTAATDTALASKQTTLTAGTGISIVDNVISATGSGGSGSSYTAGDGIDITNDVISVTGKVDTSAFTAHTADTVIHVTSDEKAAWNAKSDFSGDYNDLANKPTIPTVPTSNTAFTNDAGYITSDAISGKVDTLTYNTYTAATDTALASKQTTLTAGTGISIVDNVISATGSGGSGKAFSAGTNISITTGETADTINCTLPITATTDTTNKAIIIGQSITSDNTKNGCVIIGSDAKGTARDVIIGTKAKNAEGWNDVVAIGNEAKGYSECIAIGSYTETYRGYREGSVAIGYYARAKNMANAVAIGYEVSTTGTTKTNINNQIKIDSSNQVYISNSANTSTYCLQEKIENTEAALGGLKLVKLTQSEYDALAAKDSNTLYIING